MSSPDFLCCVSGEGYHGRNQYGDVHAARTSIATCGSGTVLLDAYRDDADALRIEGGAITAIGPLHERGARCGTWPA